GCRDKFAADPAGYLAGRGGAEANATDGASAGTVFTCPMHPEVEQLGPGDCPRCGMALEPEGLPPTATRTEWTCPMHPEIVRDEAGDCPICGMALEPRTVAVEEGDNPALRDMTRRFRFPVASTFPLLAIAMLDMLPGRPISSLISGRTRVLVELALATPVCLWS